MKKIYKYLILLLLLFTISLVYSSMYSFEYFEQPTHKTAVVFNLDKSNDAAFYSLFLFMCESYIIAKKYNYDFYIYDKEWPYLYEKGWHDYFDSLNVYTDDIGSKYANVIQCYHGNINSLIENVKDYKGTTLQEYIDCIKDIYKLKPHIIEKANEIISNMGRDYTALYIRRGDKMTSGESKYVSTSDILKMIDINNNNPLFIQTDDYTVVE